MTIDQTKEDVFQLSDGPKKVSKSYWTLRSFILHGKQRSSDGKIIYLERIELTGGLATSVEAYNRFISRLNGFEPTAPG